MLGTAMHGGRGTAAQWIMMSTRQRCVAGCNEDLWNPALIMNPEPGPALTFLTECGHFMHPRCASGANDMIGRCPECMNGPMMPRQFYFKSDMTVPTDLSLVTGADGGGGWAYMRRNVCCVVCNKDVAGVDDARHGSLRLAYVAQCGHLMHGECARDRIVNHNRRCPFARCPRRPAMLPTRLPPEPDVDGLDPTVWMDNKPNGNCMFESLAQMFYPVSLAVDRAANIDAFERHVEPLARRIRAAICDYATANPGYIRPIDDPNAPALDTALDPALLLVFASTVLNIERATRTKADISRLKTKYTAHFRAMREDREFGTGLEALVWVRMLAEFGGPGLVVRMDQTDMGALDPRTFVLVNTGAHGEHTGDHWRLRTYDPDIVLREADFPFLWPASGSAGPSRPPRMRSSMLGLSPMRRLRL